MKKIRKGLERSLVEEVLESNICLDGLTLNSCIQMSFHEPCIIFSCLVISNVMFWSLGMKKMKLEHQEHAPAQNSARPVLASGHHPLHERPMPKPPLHEPPLVRPRPPHVWPRAEHMRLNLSWGQFCLRTSG